MPATVLTEGLHAGAFIVSEAEQGFFSRDQVLVALSQTIGAGRIIGKIAVAALLTSAVAADAGNTGNGVFTMDPTAPVDTKAQNGAYRVVCEAVVANAGTFLVFDPAGVEIGRVQAAGAAFSNQIKFTIADGAVDFAVGDAFTVTVGRESGSDEQVKAWDPTAVDGSQNAAGIMLYPVVTDGAATKQGTIIARRAEVRLSDLDFGTANAAQKAACVEQLRQLGIIPR